MQVQPLALRSLKQPVAGEVVAVVSREARRDNAANGGIADHSTAGSFETEMDLDWGSECVLGSLTSFPPPPSPVPSAWGTFVSLPTLLPWS